MIETVKFVRFSAEGVREAYGIWEGDTIREISNSPIGRSYSATGREFNTDSSRLLAPNPRPPKMLCLALNYPTHLRGSEQPKRPEPFYKVVTSIIGPGDTIRIPRDAGLVACESELVAVIGKRAYHVNSDEALDYVFGYTCGNDVSAREWQSGPTADKQWWRAKSCDTFGPTGPCIVTGIDPQECTITGSVDGVEGQRCHSSEMIFSVAESISFISRYVTLEPGDMIWTGTSGTTPPITPGGDVTVEIDKIGVLNNPVDWAV